VARSLAETLNQTAHEAVGASAWERDHEAWNLPRPPGETVARGAPEDEHDARESDPAAQRSTAPGDGA
jgi:hypothetical protein